MRELNSSELLVWGGASNFFTNIFEKGSYEKAVSFMVVNAIDVYDMLNEFVESLAIFSSKSSKSKTKAAC